MKNEISKVNCRWIQKLAIGAFALAILFVPTLTYAQKFTPDGRQLVITIKDGPSAILPGQFLRFNIYNPAPAGAPAARGHVKVFDGLGRLLIGTSDVEIAAGCFQSIDIPRENLNSPGDPITGRLQVRTEMEISVWVESATRGETPTVELPTSYELVDRETGKTILIGMLLPAVQKVR